MALKKRLAQRGWTRLVLTDVYPYEDEPVWDQLKYLIQSAGSNPRLDPLVAEEVTRMMVDATNLYGISDPKVVLGRSGKPFLVDNFDFDTPHSIMGMRKNKAGLNEYLKAFNPISISPHLKESSLVGDENIVEDPTSSGRFILTPESQWKLSCDGIETTEIVRFLGQPTRVTEWRDFGSTRPKGFGRPKKMKGICFTEWSRGFEGWDSCLMVETVNKMPRSEKIMITIDQPSEGLNPKEKSSRKNLKRGQTGDIN